VFGRAETRKRERGEREVGERRPLSHVWFRREIEEREKIMWDPRIFCFSPQVRRKGADGCRFYSFTNFSLVLLVVHSNYFHYFVFISIQYFS
jgi:hypothetical protein